MSRSKRAAQFNAFDALKGLTEAILARQKIAEPRRYLAEDAAMELNEVLCSLVKGELITAVYYCQYEEEYKQLTGNVKKVDPIFKTLTIGETMIDFSEINQIQTFL